MFHINEIDVHELDRLRAAPNEPLLLLDVRSQMEVLQGKIDGSEHLPLHLLPLRAQDLPRDKRIVIYCRTGARSAQACAYLSSNFGMTNTYNLVGGIVSWAQNGKPIV